MEMEYKKTAIRMPLYLWDELTVVSKKYGISNNSMMVLLIGNFLNTERQKEQLLSPEGIGKVISQLNYDQLSIFNNTNSAIKK